MALEQPRGTESVVGQGWATGGRRQKEKKHRGTAEKASSGGHATSNEVVKCSRAGEICAGRHGFCGGPPPIRGGISHRRSKSYHSTNGIRNYLSLSHSGGEARWTRS